MESIILTDTVNDVVLKDIDPSKAYKHIWNQ